MTGVTIRMWIKLEIMPPMTGGQGLHGGYDAGIFQAK